jgi:hypothetical protein
VRRSPDSIADGWPLCDEGGVGERRVVFAVRAECPFAESEEDSSEVAGKQRGPIGSAGVTSTGVASCCRPRTQACERLSGAAVLTIGPPRHSRCRRATASRWADLDTMRRDAVPNAFRIQPFGFVKSAAALVRSAHPVAPLRTCAAGSIEGGRSRVAERRSQRLSEKNASIQASKGEVAIHPRQGGLTKTDGELN